MFILREYNSVIRIKKSRIEVNISLSKFKISLKLYLQENSLQLKYTK